MQSTLSYWYLLPWAHWDLLGQGTCQCSWIWPTFMNWSLLYKTHTNTIGKWSWWGPRCNISVAMERTILISLVAKSGLLLRNVYNIYTECVEMLVVRKYAQTMKVHVLRKFFQFMMIQALIIWSLTYHLNMHVKALGLWPWWTCMYNDHDEHQDNVSKIERCG